MIRSHSAKVASHLVCVTIACIAGSTVVACGSGSTLSALTGTHRDTGNCAIYSGANPTVDEFMNMEQESLTKKAAIWRGANKPKLAAAVDRQNQPAILAQMRESLSLIVSNIPAGSVAKYTQMLCDFAYEAASSVPEPQRDKINAAFANPAPDDLQAGKQLLALHKDYAALDALTPLVACGMSLRTGNKLDISAYGAGQAKNFSVDTYRMFCPQQIKS